MSRYFDFSQRVKEEIPGNYAMTQILDNHMGRKVIALRMRSGSSNNHYSIGMLESGLWVVVRQRLYSFDVGLSKTYLDCYETYATNAESLDAEGKRVTKFCIGVAKDRAAALIVEDLTEGGRRKIIHQGRDETGYFEDNPDEIVHIDLDDMPREFRAYRFMGKSARINL